MSKSNIPTEAIEELKVLEKSFGSRISKELKELEKRLTLELQEKLAAVAKKYQLAFCGMYSDSEEWLSNFDNAEEILKRVDSDIHHLAKMYTNNAITESSICNDPSGDWDGFNRGENFHEQCISIEKINQFDFESGEFKQ